MIRSKMILISLIVMALTSLPTIAMAFGGEGHRIIGYVAEELLTPKTRIKLHQLTGGETLDQTATYMDEHKNELGSRIRKWHYDNAPVCSNASIADYCPSGNCASQQIARLTRVLSSTSTSTHDKREAAIYLSHLVGDIHQPLHAADNHDKGGNAIHVRGRGKYSKNLHSLWDSDFVKRPLRGMSEHSYAELLLSEYANKIPGWQHGSTTDWMAESRRYAINEAYGLLEGFSCGYSQSPAFVAISPAYREVAELRVREQLVKAGARLAYLINQALM
jgi:hypothetical protein